MIAINAQIILKIKFLKQNKAFYTLSTNKKNIFLNLRNIQGDSRVIMSPTELKMQPTIHLEIQLYVPNVLWVAFSSSVWAHYYLKITCIVSLKTSWDPLLLEIFLVILS
jgi:hypothetical protein